MANLQKTLDALQPYVIGIRYLEGLPVIDTVFKDGWTLIDSDVIERVKGNQELNYYMIFSQKNGIGLDELLDYVSTVIKANIEREKKHELFKEKVNELKEVFKKNSLVKLKKLKFLFNDEDTVSELNDFDLEEVPEVPEVDLEVEEPSEFITPSAPETISTENLTEEEKEILKEEERAENYKKVKEHKKYSQSSQNKVELPPKKIFDAVMVDTMDSDCECGPNEACNKCIGTKDL